MSRLGDWSATQKSRKHPVQIRERFPKPERAEEAPLESSARPNRSTDEPSGFGFKRRSFRTARPIDRICFFLSEQRENPAIRLARIYWLSIVPWQSDRGLESRTGKTAAAPSPRSKDLQNHLQNTKQRQDCAGRVQSRASLTGRRNTRSTHQSVRWPPP